MDKYAVDLDQVLNDFEYSELTDQHSSTRNVHSVATSFPQSNITRHSINNVFHSLNEYLNTSINVNNLNQIDNVSVENKENVVGDTNAVNVSQGKIGDEEESINEYNFKTDSLLLDFNQETIENKVGVSEVKLDDFKEKSDAVDRIDVNSEEKSTEDVIDVEKSEDKDEEKTEVYINGECNETIAEIIDIKLDVNVEESVEICDKNVTNTVEILEEKPVEKVGFSDDVELDESEVIRMLEELEEEEQRLSKELDEDDAKSAAVVLKVEDKPVQETNISQVTQDAKTEPLIKEQEEIINQKETIHLSDETSKSPQVVTDESSTNNKEIITKEVDDEVVEQFNDEEIQVESLVTEEKVTETHNSLKETETVEQVPKTEQQEESRETLVKENEEIEVEEDNSLLRPQDLNLNSGDQPKRKINLIGDPGSTPYNNVYINKEIPKNKDKAYDSDTDYSTSSSVTFSDASSTTSTISADEMHNQLENNPIQQEERISEVALQNPTLDSDNPTSEAQNPTADSENPAADAVNLVTEQTVPQEVVGNTLNNAPGDSSGDGAAQVESLANVSVEKQWLGKEAPLWIPDSDAMSCLHCDMKFTVLKRRHHCRACGLVLCSKCCHLRFRLEYLDAEARVCNKCHDILNKDTNSTSSSDMSPDVGNSPSYRPNPNNPLEYCSTVSPLQQVAGSNPNPPAVMVPVGVLKRKGSGKGKSNKSVMFCDGIRPGSDLTNLDSDFDYSNSKTKISDKASAGTGRPKRNLPVVDPETNTFIPSSENNLPPTVTISKTEIFYVECQNNPSTVETLKKEQLTFALHLNLLVHVKIINMSCCINKTAWCFATEGLINVGQDEIVILLEYIDEEAFVPKDVFYHINSVHNDAVKGTSVKELGLSLHNTSNFLDSKNHAGFVYIRPTFQCLENIIKPKEPYLIGILIHRWETPWAKLFPLRLILRLGAEYRYYPSPIISTRHRESVFVEIGHTIINLLADFRNFSYTLPQIRGLIIHMEDKNTTITIPANRYDQVMKSMSNSSDHILAFAGNFSQQADSHLVCIQDTQGNENCYSTHAINIHNKPRKVTGASFIVFNGALKSSSGLTAKSNIVEDGLMIQVLPEHMQLIRDNLRAMKDHTIPCGCVNAATDETVNIVWGENDVNFNVGVLSAIDNIPLSGIPSIRVHNAKNHVCANGNRLIRWTEVFIIQNGEDNPKHQDSFDISRVSESIAKATCDALIKYLDLLVANNCQKIGIRTTLHVDNVSYLAGSNGSKLPPIYMKSLDDELIPVLHRITTNNLGEHSIVLELIFRILNL